MTIELEGETLEAITEAADRIAEIDDRLYYELMPEVWEHLEVTDETRAIKREVDKALEGITEQTEAIARALEI